MEKRPLTKKELKEQKREEEMTALYTKWLREGTTNVLDEIFARSIDRLNRLITD